MFLNKEASFSMDIDHISEEAFNLLTQPNPDETFKAKSDGYITELRQKRKHRCKRINKKWRKRYGFVEVKIPVSLIFNKVKMNNDGELEILADNKGEFYNMIVGEPCTT